MEKDLNKVVGQKPKFDTQYINLTKIKSQIKELNQEIEKRLQKHAEEKEKKSNG